MSETQTIGVDPAVLGMATRTAVVGAGPAGLCAARHAQAAGHAVTVYEQSEDLGGIWLYTDCVGTDRYGIPVHSSLYRDLRINLPKDITMFPEISHKNREVSYLQSEEILQYLHDYADMFGLRKLIKYTHHVNKIKRLAKEWEVTVVDLPSNTEHTSKFDVVFVCNGLNNKCSTAVVPGAEDFTGHSLHSHDYRTPEPFSGQDVLIIGGGPSALDLTNFIAKVANRVFLSHHSPWFKNEDLKAANNVVFKPDVFRLRSNSAEFVDDTEEHVDTIVYCTGYLCNYAFLDESCGIEDDEGFVFPLYKHIINANHRTMCVLGNLGFSMQFPTFDIQVRFFMKTLTDPKILPEKEDMFKEILERVEKKVREGKRKKSYFYTNADEDAEYFAELAAMANIQSVPRVLSNIHSEAIKQLFQNFPLFRNDRYEVLDDNNFLIHHV